MNAGEKLTLYQESLRGAGMRHTSQRRLICEYLAQTDHHPTAYEVFAELSSEHPEISRATVYNTLNTLKQLGAIVELSVGADHTHYETDPSPHVNLICLHCRRVTDFRSELAFGALWDGLREAAGFLPLAARADVMGWCAECRATSQTAGSPENVRTGIIARGRTASSDKST
jgi:Fe2+ or Zn2+ uptake regulation protein